VLYYWSHSKYRSIATSDWKTVAVEIRWDEMTGPRRDAVGSKLSAYSKAQEIKQTGRKR